MTSILGLDISSFQLNACLLVDDQPPVLRMERLGSAKDPLIERVRRVPTAVDRLADIDPDSFVTATGHPIRPDWIVIESAFGHGAHALHLTTGAIIASCPSESQVALISSGDWRKELGAKNTKADGHAEVLAWMLEDEVGQRFDFDVIPDEHELDAIGIALAWRTILASNQEQATDDTKTRATKTRRDT